LNSELLNLQQKWATKKVLLVFVLVYFLFPFYFLPQILPEGKPLDLHIYYSATDAYRLLSSYSEAGRASYIIGSATIDMVYPLCYATFLGLVLTFFISSVYPSKSQIQQIRLFPYSIFVADVLENLCIITLLKVYPDELEWLASLSGFLTLTKWVLFFICMIMLLYFSLNYYRYKKRLN